MQNASEEARAVGAPRNASPTDIATSMATFGIWTTSRKFDFAGKPSAVDSVHAEDALIPENVELMARQVYYAPDKAVRELGIPRVSVPELISEFIR